MAEAFRLATAYNDDWRHYDGVQDAAYEPPPGQPDEDRDEDGDNTYETGLKVKLGGAVQPDFAGLSGQFVNRDKTVAAMMWNPTDRRVTPRVNGLLITATDSWVIRTATQFLEDPDCGVWQLQLEPERTDSAD